MFICSCIKNAAGFQPSCVVSTTDLLLISQYIWTYIFPGGFDMDGHI